MILIRRLGQSPATMPGEIHCGGPVWRISRHGLVACGEVVRSNPARREYPCLIGKHTSKAARLGQSRDDHNESDQHKDRERDVPIAEHDILDELLQ